MVNTTGVPINEAPGATKESLHPGGGQDTAVLRSGRRIESVAART